MTSFPAFAWLFVQTVSEKWRAMYRFGKFFNADVKYFSQKRENANTKNKTSYNLKLFKDFLAREEIPAAELQEFAIKFVLSVGKKIGE